MWGEVGKTGNNGPLLSDNAAETGPEILNISRSWRMFRRMKQIARIISLALWLALAAGAAQASCVVEYKAKRDNPLELFYGTAQVGGDCSQADATERLRAQLAQQGLTLLKVLSVTGQ